MSWRQLIILALYATVCFGGSFSDFTCTSGSNTVTVDKNDKK